MPAPRPAGRGRIPHREQHGQGAHPAGSGAFGTAAPAERCEGGSSRRGSQPGAPLPTSHSCVQPPQPWPAGSRSNRPRSTRSTANGFSADRSSADRSTADFGGSATATVPNGNFRGWGAWFRIGTGGSGLRCRGRSLPGRTGAQSSPGPPSPAGRAPPPEVASPRGMSAAAGGERFHRGA
jgi:hypothetical protein